MNVLHITNNFPTRKHPVFGVFVKEQIESLSKLNINNEVLFINGREKGKLEYLKAIWRIRKKLKNKKFDIIHCHHALSALCLILSRQNNHNRVIVSFQNDPINEYGKTVFNFIKKNTQGWIFKNNSNLIRDKYSFYLPNGVNTNFFVLMAKSEARKVLNLNLDEILILFVSSNYIRKQKRYDKFIETLSILREKYNYKNIKEILLINTEREKIPFYINAVDVHLLTSDFEGSPNSVKECMACNTSIVSTNVGNVKDLLSDVEGSHVADNNSAEELAKLVNRSLKESVSNGREELIKQELEIGSVATKLVNIYEKIINKI